MSPCAVVFYDSKHVPAECWHGICYAVGWEPRCLDGPWGWWVGVYKTMFPRVFLQERGGSVCKDVFSPILIYIIYRYIYIYIYYFCLKKDLFFVHSISLGQEIELFKLMIITSCKAFFQLSSDQTKTLVGCFLQRIALPSCEQGPCLNQLGFHEMSLPVCCHWSAIQEQSVRTVQGPIWSETP